RSYRARRFAVARRSCRAQQTPVAPRQQKSCSCHASRPTSCKNRASFCRPALNRVRKCREEICRSPATPARDKPVASASASSGKSQGTGRRDRKDRTEFRSLCGRWRRYICATNQARGARVRQCASVGRDAFRQKQKNPFQEKVIISISRGKCGLQSRKKQFAGRKGARRQYSTISTSWLPEFPESQPCHNARCR